MSKKYYDASVWASGMRTRRNIKDIAVANPWDYFMTLTFDVSVARDYWAVKKCANVIKKDIERAGGAVLMLIGVGVNSRYHVHALVRGVPQEFLEPGAAYARLIIVKTHGRLWTLANADKYGMGLHVVQTIGNQDDINRIADYMAGHVLDMRDMIAQGILAGIIDKTVHLYSATRGLARSKRYVWMVGCLKVRLYDNRIKPAAVVLPACVAGAVSDWIEPDKIERYRSRGRGHTPMMRITGRLRDIHMALLLSDAVNLSPVN